MIRQSQMIERRLNQNSRYEFSVQGLSGPLSDKEYEQTEDHIFVERCLEYLRTVSSKQG